MFELASRLVGVYKVNHMTKSVTVENRSYIVKQRAIKEEQERIKTKGLQASRASQQVVIA